MIPKRAIFYWEGPEMGWLRKQSLETFRRLNPSWQITVIGGGDLPIKGDSTLERVLRSDWARYRELFESGGIYFDTDIVFCKPIPDFWLDSDLILPHGDERIIDHVAVLGAKRGEAFFGMVQSACEQAIRDDGVYNYQFFGVQLINRLSSALAGRRTQWLPPDSYLPVPWHRPERLWSDGSYLSPLTYGVHWYGGDWTSISFEKKCDEKWAQTSGCLVAQAIRQSLRSSGDLEAHREQLGV